MMPNKMNALVFRNTPARWVACKALGRVWPGVYLSGVGGLRLREMPVPALPGDDWVLCQTRLGGLCGTDLNMIFMQQHPGSLIRQFISWPVFMGHENVATIVECGRAVRDLTPGLRVLAEPPLACAARKIDPPCPACREGKPSTCWNFDRGAVPPALGLGYNNFTGGTWSPYFVAHVSQIYPVPDGIRDEQAILIDPLACSLHAVLQDLPARPEKVLVFGAGIIGLGVILALRALNLPVEITATVRYPHQADLARACGADHTVFWSQSAVDDALRQLAPICGARDIHLSMKMRFLQGGFDRLYDCTGRAAALVDAQRLLRSGGRLVIAGTPQLGLMDMTSTWFRELHIIGATGRAVERLPGQDTAKHNYQHVIELIQAAKLDLTRLPVALYRQHDCRRAFAAIRNRSKNPAVKSAFDFR